MNINSAVNDLIAMLKPDIPPMEAQRLLREHIPPHNLRRLSRWLKRLEPEKLQVAEQKGPQWLISPEGWEWLQKQRQ